MNQANALYLLIPFELWFILAYCWLQVTQDANYNAINITNICRRRLNQKRK